jgi:hypothetical protein
MVGPHMEAKNGKGQPDGPGVAGAQELQELRSSGVRTQELQELQELRSQGLRSCRSYGYFCKLRKELQIRAFFHRFKPRI